MKRVLSVAGPLVLVVACYGEAGTEVNASAVPAADVELVTDDLGITHVYAMSDADALYGGGYAMARDRLFQMELVRRQALGTSAEILGASAVKGDIGARAFAFAALGRADEAHLRSERPDDAALVDAWVAGVNARIDEIARGAAPRPYGLGAGELDFVPAKWEAWQPYAIAKVLAFGLSNSLDAEILATALLRISPTFVSSVPILQPAYDSFTLGGAAPAGPAPKPELPKSAAPPVPAAALVGLAPLHFLFEGGHSNNWAVDGAHSTNGRPLLAGDPHQPLSSPSRFYPTHLSSVAGGGTLDAIGFAFTGTPVVELGHNARVGWTATTNFADAMDMWDVKTNDDVSVVHLGDGDHPVKRRTETIAIRGSGTQDVTLYDVPGYGILLPEAIIPLPRSLLVDGDAILFAWTGFAPTRELSAYLGLDRARTVDDVEAASSLIDVGALNLVAADAHHIDYVVHARVPDRGDPRAHPMPWRILPGSDAATFWTHGDLPAERLPHWRDPPRGYLATANNDPFGFTADGSVENDSFYYGAFYSTAMRAHRIEEMLSASLANGQKLTRDDIEAMQRDTHSGMADTIVPLVTAAVHAAASDPALAAYRDRKDLADLATALDQWDRRIERPSGEAVVLVALEWFAAKRAFAGTLSSLLFDAIAQKSPPFLLGQLRNVLADRFEGADALYGAAGRDAFLLAALDDTAAWLDARFHTKNLAAIRWSDVAFAEFDSPYGNALNAPPVAVDGACDTVKVAEASFFAAGKPRDTMSASEVSLYRMAMSFADDGTVDATVNFARGASGEPQSPHFDDMQSSWVDGRPLPLPFRRAEVDAHATARSVLRGAGKL